ncbi:MAG: hypothetical protein KKE30_20795 [Gammaproteobacteria bacterium]|nr:hypothetical protein [Gammaproteobacteria bacterium]
MLIKSLVFLSIATLLFSNTLKASEKEIAETGFKNLMDCIKKVPLEAEQYNGVSSQQILLLAVIKNINNDSKPIENIDIDIDIDIDYPKLYQLVKSSCPKELEQVEKLAPTEQG